MDADTGGKVMGNGTAGRYATVNQFQGNGVGMGRGMQLKANQDGGIKEAGGSTGVDERVDLDRRLAGGAEVDEKRKVRRGGRGERGGKRGGESATQPGSY